MSAGGFAALVASFHHARHCPAGIAGNDSRTCLSKGSGNKTSTDGLDITRISPKVNKADVNFSSDVPITLSGFAGFSQEVSRCHPLFNAVLPAFALCGTGMGA